MKRWRWRRRRTPLAWGGAGFTGDEGADARRGDHGDTYTSNPITTLNRAEPAIVDAGLRTSAVCRRHASCATFARRRAPSA